MGRAEGVSLSGLEHLAILSNRKIAPDSCNCRIFCAEPASTSAENALTLSHDEKINTRPRIVRELNAGITRLELVLQRLVNAGATRTRKLVSTGRQHMAGQPK